VLGEYCMKLKSSILPVIGLWGISIILLAYSIRGFVGDLTADTFPIIVPLTLIAFSCYLTWKWNRGIVHIENMEMILGHRSGVEVVIQCEHVSHIKFIDDTMYIDIGTTALKLPDIDLSSKDKDRLLTCFRDRKFA
jgi:hypothetical protein